MDLLYILVVSLFDKFAYSVYLFSMHNYFKKKTCHFFKADKKFNV